MSMQNVDNGANANVPINENFETLEHQAVYGNKQDDSSGLVWAYYGGRWGGFAVTQDDLTLTNAATNYIVVDRSDGTISVSTSNTNWNNDTDYARVYLITTAGSLVTAVQDHRAGPGGVHGGGGGSSASTRNAVTALATSGSVAIDYDLGDYFTLALAGNVSTFTFSNLPGAGFGASLMIRITQDSTPRTVGWPGSFEWEGGTPPSVSTGSGVVDLLAITTFNNGTSWQATLVQDFS